MRPETRALRKRPSTTSPAGLSRRALLRAGLIAGSGLLAACTLERAGPELPPVTLPPVEVVQPPPLPTSTPEPTAPRPTAASASVSAPQSPAVTIYFETWGPRVLLNAFSEIAQESREAIPWVTVQARLDNALSSDGLRTRLRNDEGPDVTRVEPEDVFDLTAAGFLHGLGARVSGDPELREAAPAAPAARTGAGGELSTLSIGATHQCLLYNAQHLESVGVTAPMSWQSPWTVDEFEEAARRLVIANNQRVERFGLTAIPAYARPVLAEKSDDWLASDQRASMLSTPQRRERLQRLTDWQTNLDIELPTAYRFVAPFSGGLASMHIDHTDVGRWVRASVPWGVAPLPAWEGRESLTEANELCVAIPAHSSEPDAAWTFARFLLDAPAQRALARTNLLTPTRLETLEDPAYLDPNQRPYNRTQLVEAAAKAMRSPAHPGAKAWHALTGDAIAPVRQGKEDAAAYLERADALITRQLRLRGWSAAADRPGYRQPLPFGNWFLAGLEERGL
ncbi:MAG: extracellular solute-binding protein [Chloroflexota bacterium]|nr:extracellular solute-binding protein [Chloroflexota bacterium]MDE2897851.1 extracellular solute-binding protein [Chloroflexota bacterium]